MATLSTPLCDRLGIDIPIVQAPIGSVSGPALAAAVSNAGGLGTLAITWRDLATTRDVIRETAAATDRPFAVNLVVDESAQGHPPAAHVETCLDEGVDLFSFAFGDATDHAATVREAGGTVLWTVGSEAGARQALAGGADVLVAQGREAGGHVQGEATTMALVPTVADLAADRDVPVVAAGGIGDGRGIAAALALGADGAWLGTRFVATEEARAHPQYRDRITDGAATDTTFSALFDKGWPGVPHRTLRNETVEAWEDAGEPAPGHRPGEDDVVAQTSDGEDVERYSDLPPMPGMAGDVEALPMYAGQSVGQVDDVRPAADVVATLVEETCRRIDQSGSLVDG